MTGLMTLRELADYLRVTEKTVYRLISRGDIQAGKVGRQWRFEKSAIDQWLRRNSAGNKSAVLVIDDEHVIRELLREILVELGHGVIAAETGAEGLELLEQVDFGLVFLDLKMPGMDGAEVFRRIRQIKPELPVIIITGYPDSELMARALAQGPFGMMNKPFGEADVYTAVNNFLHITQR